MDFANDYTNGDGTANYMVETGEPVARSEVRIGAVVLASVVDVLRLVASFRTLAPTHPHTHGDIVTR